MLNLGKKATKIIPLKVKLPFDEKAAIVESLGIMLDAGIPILEALDSIEADSTSPKTKQVVQIIRDSTQKGHTLAESFSQFPNIFDEILINTVKAGEEIGTEVHESVDQFFRMEEGEAKVILNNGEVEKNIKGEWAVIIPAGTWHNVINAGKKPLKLYTLYSPPAHLKDVVEATKADEKEEHFDGQTDE